MYHKLKTLPEHFDAVIHRVKTFEVRKDDRNFKVGDFLHLLEWDSSTNEYTGRDCICPVLHILEGGHFGIESGYVVISIAFYGR